MWKKKKKKEEEQRPVSSVVVLSVSSNYTNIYIYIYTWIGQTSHVFIGVIIAHIMFSYEGYDFSSVLLCQQL